MISEDQDQSQQSSTTLKALKVVVSAALLLSSGYTVVDRLQANNKKDRYPHRRLSLLGLNGDNYYVDDIEQELKGRQKLFDDAKPNEIKYWFEYSGKLQVNDLFLNLLHRLLH